MVDRGDLLSDVPHRIDRSRAKSPGKASTQAVTVKSSGLGNPGWTLTNCLGLGVSCTFTTASAVLNADGGTAGALTAIGIALARTSGLCPAGSARYVISSSRSAWLVPEP
jgi:hypothetical protein